MRIARTLGRTFTCLIALVGLAAVSQVATSAQDNSPAAPPGSVTFSKDIAPILQRRCENCHRKGGVAPMALTTYEEVRPFAKAMQRKTRLREMPPWFIEKNIGIQRFKDDMSLSEEEITKIGQWADLGAPQGNPADMPPPRQYADDSVWTIGTPDVIVKSDVMTVKALAPDWYAELGPTPTGFTEDRYVAAVEIKEVRLDGKMGRVEGRKPGDLNYFTVHHAGIHEVDGEGIDRTKTDGFGDGFYIVHQLGANATVYPDDTGILIKAGSAFTYTVHLHSIGREVPVRLDIGFKFHPKGWKPKYQQAGFVLMGNLTDEIDIRPNQPNVRFDAFYKMPKAGIITTFEPHMHSSGQRMCVEVLYPDGKRREMLNCAAYNHNWVRVYSYEEDVMPILPKDTLLHIMGWYNNTASNPRAIEPRNWKGYGQRSIDDMFIFQPRVTWLADEQYKQLIAEREAKTKSRTTEGQ